MFCKYGNMPPQFRCNNEMEFKLKLKLQFLFKVRRDHSSFSTY